MYYQSCICSPTSYELIEINGSKISSVRVVKLLGVYFQDNLKWNNHVSETIKKAVKHLYFLTQLKRANVPSSELAKFYVACIQSVGSEILSFQQAQDILTDIYYNYICKLVLS